MKRLVCLVQFISFLLPVVTAFAQSPKPAFDPHPQPLYVIEKGDSTFFYANCILSDSAMPTKIYIAKRSEAQSKFGDKGQNGALIITYPATKRIQSLTTILKDHQFAGEQLKLPVIIDNDVHVTTADSIAVISNENGIHSITLIPQDTASGKGSFIEIITCSRFEFEEWNRTHPNNKKIRIR